MTRVAIVIFVIGDRYVHSFNSIFKESVEAYCKIHNYDLIVLNRPIRPEPSLDKKKFFWQRLLIPSQYLEYDYVVSLDSDIYIHRDAPPFPLSDIPKGHVAAVNERKYLGNYEWRETIQLKCGYERTGRDWYALSGETKDYDDHINGGLVIYQPTYHARLMEDLYNNNIDNYKRYHQDDQSFLSSYLIDNKIIHWLDERFNRVWFFWREIMYPSYQQYPQQIKLLLMNTYMERNYFCHFAGNTDFNILQMTLKEKNSLIDIMLRQ